MAEDEGAVVVFLSPLPARGERSSEARVRGPLRDSERRKSGRFVMPGLVPGIHVLLGVEAKTWMAGTSPAMTGKVESHSRWQVGEFLLAER